MFPFGFGLSYTTFEITAARLSSPVFDYDEEDMTLSVTIKNTGALTGKEVVQLYLGQPGATLIKPVRELKAFEKVELAPGEEKTLCFMVTREMLRSFDEEAGGLDGGARHVRGVRRHVLERHRL